ncbi:MAG: CPBP family intramembrane metalloprotease [Anaerolineales bacterium]|nr:CPBP family intramembrane metalloprotease [Anaerolineales bacterium]
MPCETTRSKQNRGARQPHTRRLAGAVAVYLIFCGLSLLSQVAYPLLGLVVLMGIALPLAWGKATGNWAAMGFTRNKLGLALAWGIAAGVLTGLIGIAVVPQRTFPPQLGLQLAIGIPIWALIASPFQEFFFRGWLQSRFEAVLGPRWGLLLATACFTLWHYCAPFVGRTAVPLATPIGALSTFGAGLLYAHAFQRSGNILAPWLAHVISGIVFVLVGAMDFTQPVW